MTHRLLPNLAISVSWVVMVVVAVDTLAPRDYFFNIVDVLVDGYQNGRMSDGLLESLLKLYGIGFFGTVLVSLGPEIAKGIWSDEVRSTDNKSLLAKLKRDRRQIILRYTRSRVSINGTYLRLLVFGIVFALTLVLVLVKARTYAVTFETDLFLLFIAASMEAVGIFTHSVISDHALVSAEAYYMRQRRKRLSTWLENSGWRNSERINTYFTVLIHSYCNYGLTVISHEDLFPKPVQAAANQPESPLKQELADDRNLDIALRLIEQFDSVKKQYIEPFEEKYWVNARESFEPAFALDLKQFLFPCALDSKFPSSRLRAIGLAKWCFFDKQKSQWQEWLYTSGASFETIVAELMLTYLRMRSFSLQSPSEDHSASSNQASNSEERIELASLLLEFPYIMEACIKERRDRFNWSQEGKEKSLEGKEKPLWSHDYFHLTEDNHPPKYRERVEQYYAELFKETVNELDADACNKIASRFVHFLTYIYEEGNRPEPYLHRILPVNSNHFRATYDVPTASILFTREGLKNLDEEYANPVLAWQAIIQEEIKQSKAPNFRCSRLCQYNFNGRTCDHRAKHHDSERNTGYCCVSIEEQCEAFASILFESL